MRSLKLLITAFEPFGGRPCNTSADLLRELKKSPAAIGFSSYAYALLPVHFQRAWPALRQQLMQHKPDVVLLTGEKPQGRLTLEAVAHNVRTSRVGLIAIKKNSPARISSSFPAREMAMNLNKRNSSQQKFFTADKDAGNFLCNFIYYRMLSARKKIPTLFIHVPALTPVEYGLEKEKYLTGMRQIILELAKAIDGAGANCSPREN